MIHSARLFYSRILKVPLLGHLVGSLVRGIKRLFGVTGYSSSDRGVMLTSSVAGLKSLCDRQQKEIENLRNQSASQNVQLMLLATCLEQLRSRRN